MITPILLCSIVLSSVALGLINVQRWKLEESNDSYGADVTGSVYRDIKENSTIPKPNKLPSTINYIEYAVNKSYPARISCNLTIFLKGVARQLIDQDVNNLKWYHNGREVSFEHRYNKHRETGQLIIDYVRPDDSGIWYCQDDVIGVVSKSVSLIVLEEPKIPYLLLDGKRLNGGNQFLPIAENTELVIMCIVEGGHPAPKIDWLLLDGSRGFNNTTDRFITGLKITNNAMPIHWPMTGISEARLSPVLRSHNDYMIVCIASHMHLQMTLNVSVLLQVQYPPSFVVSRIPNFGYPVIVNSSISMRCIVDSNPVTHPVWLQSDMKQLTTLDDNGFLNITSVQMSHRGWYECSAKYLGVDYFSSFFTLNVIEADLSLLEQHMDPSTIEITANVNLGESLELKCTAGSVPCWGRKLSIDNYLKPLRSGKKLSIPNILYQEAGVYICAASGYSPLAKGKYESFLIDVTGPPMVNTPEKILNVTLDEKVKFDLEYCANPPVRTIFWMHKLEIYLPGSVKNDIISGNITDGDYKYCYKVELIIPSVKRDHIGEYSLVLLSDVGVSGGSVILNLENSATVNAVSNMWAASWILFHVVLFIIFI